VYEEVNVCDCNCAGEAELNDFNHITRLY